MIEVLGKKASILQAIRMALCRKTCRLVDVEVKGGYGKPTVWQVCLAHGFYHPPPSS